MHSNRGSVCKSFVLRFCRLFFKQWPIEKVGDVGRNFEITTGKKMKLSVSQSYEDRGCTNDVPHYRGRCN